MFLLLPEGGREQEMGKGEGRAVKRGRRGTNILTVPFLRSTGKPRTPLKNYFKRGSTFCVPISHCTLFSVRIMLKKLNIKASHNTDFSGMLIKGCSYLEAK